MKNFTIEEDDAGRRLDRVLRRLLNKTSSKNYDNNKHFSNHCSLSAIYSAIRKGEIKLNGKKVKPHSLTALNDILSIENTLLEGYLIETTVSTSKLEEIGENSQNKKRAIQAQNAKNSKKSSKITVLFKNNHLLFINKELGVATHGTNSIDEMIKGKFAGRKSLSFVVAALHRLDKNTTGVLTFSQSLQGAKQFSQSLRDGTVDRYYLSINEGFVKSGRWQIKHNSLTKRVADKKEKPKEEITDVHLIEYNEYKNISLVSCKLVTGKKHQIRKGAEHFGTPLFCDIKYGSKRNEYSTYFLHAFALQFEKTFDLSPSIIIAPMPKRFIGAIKKMFPKVWHTLEKIGEESFLKEIIF